MLKVCVSLYHSLNQYESSEENLGPYTAIHIVPLSLSLSLYSIRVIVVGSSTGRPDPSISVIVSRTEHIHCAFCATQSAKQIPAPFYITILSDSARVKMRAL
jgi:hypothetical protein